jgi:excisionase family DNA binding protein
MRSLRDWHRYLDEQQHAAEEKRAQPIRPSRRKEEQKAERPAHVLPRVAERVKHPVSPTPAAKPPLIAVPYYSPTQREQLKESSLTPPPGFTKPSHVLPDEGVGEPRPIEPEEPAQGKLFDVQATRPSQEDGVVEPPVRPHSNIPLSILRTLEEPEKEVAEKSYKGGFSETRRELIERLFDPVLSLEETARVLNVCPTTVRRYTNRGLLRHHRTVGNQRRFRLSDVIRFIESQEGARGSEAGGQRRPKDKAR